MKPIWPKHTPGLLWPDQSSRHHGRHERTDMTTEPTPTTPDEEPQAPDELEQDDSGTFHIYGDENDGVIPDSFTRPTGFAR